MKAQQQRHDNCSLRIENDKIRCDNIVIQEALKNVICPNCGGLSVAEDSYFDEQKLKMENAILKDEDYTVEHESFVLCAANISIFFAIDAWFVEEYTAGIV